MQVCLVRKEEHLFGWVAEVYFRNQADGGELKPFPVLADFLESWKSMKPPALCQQSAGDVRYFVGTHPSEEGQRPPTLLPQTAFFKGKNVGGFSPR